MLELGLATWVLTESTLVLNMLAKKAASAIMLALILNLLPLAKTVVMDILLALFTQLVPCQLATPAASE